jgi:hypothetical protein
MSFLSENSKEPVYTEQQLKSTFIPIQGRKPKYTNERSSTGLPNYGMSPWQMVTSVLTSLGITPTPPPPPISPVLWGNILVVSEFTGDDTTALRNDIAKPFKSYNAAITAAQSGDTIIVLAGSYKTSVLITPGVNLYCMPDSTINVNVDANSLSISGTQGIYGFGIFIFSTPTIQDILIPTTDDSYFTFEALKISYVRTSLIWNNYKSFIFNVNLVQSENGGGTLCIEETRPYSKTKVIINEIYEKSSETKSITLVQLGTSSTVDININAVEHNNLNPVNGFIYTAFNDENTLLNINVNSLFYNGGSTFAQSTAPLIADAYCYARKNYSINNISTTGYLYRWSTTASTANKELGKIKLTGKVNNWSAGFKLDTFIDFAKHNQYINFELDITDNTTENHGGSSAPLNIASETGYQRISGRIVSERIALTTDALIVYGTYTSGTIAPFAATLENFTIITSGAPSIRYNGLGSSDIPCKSVYANYAASLDNGGIVPIIDTTITINTAVI